MQRTIADCIAVRARSQAAQPAIEMLGGASLSYEDCWRRVLALAAALADVAPGRHGRMVALALANGADAVLAYLACQWAGIAAVPLNTRLADPEIAYILDDSDAGLILCDATMRETMARIAGARAVRRVEEIAAANADGGPARGTADAAAVIGYTSGTTGFPRGVEWSNRHFLTHIMRWGWEFGLTGDQVMLVPGPLFHLSYAGLSLAALAIGARVRIMPAFEAGPALDELTERCSFAFLVPSMTGLIAEEWRRRGEPPVPALRFMISSGAPGPLALTETAMRMFSEAKVCEAYGWTEGGWVSFEVKHPDTLLAHSVGWPTVGNDVAVFDDRGDPCPPGVAGEVGARGLTHFDGYLGRPAETAAAWNGDYVMSGDVGIWQPDGRLTIVDRKKDMIISGGENVYTAEVERILHEHPGVLEAAVVGLPDPRWGEAVSAMVVPRPGAKLAANDLVAFCRERLAGYKVPRRIDIAPDLPRNSMGKVQKFRVIEVMGETAGG